MSVSPRFNSCEVKFTPSKDTTWNVAPQLRMTISQAYISMPATRTKDVIIAPDDGKPISQTDAKVDPES